MVEVIVRDGTWTFDGDIVRIVPGHDKRVHSFVRGPGRADRADHRHRRSGVRARAKDAGRLRLPIVGMTNGFLRFRVTGASALQPKHDPKCTTWGWIREGGTTSLLAAAVVARLPHPNAPAEQPAALPEAPSPDGADGDHDTVLRRPRELGDLHRDGVLTDDEFASAKQALLREL